MTGAARMHAMVLQRARSGRVEPIERLRPTANKGQILVRVRACGVCRTDLHVVDGDLPHPSLPVIPGHEIIGEVVELGEGVGDLAVGDRVGVPWLGWTCGRCVYCGDGRENLCPEARFTGYQLDGGYADYAVADARYSFRLPDLYEDAEAAPLLCAGLIGYRSYRLAGDGRRLAVYGFGAAAHSITRVAVADGREVSAFTRPGDQQAQAFARDLGAAWAGDSGDAPPEPFDAAILFAPVGALLPEALRRSERGATIVCAGIHMSDIPAFPYRILWEERTVRSVANLTRQDALEFLALAPTIPVRTAVTTYPLDRANQALDDLREGRFTGAAVLLPN